MSRLVVCCLLAAGVAHADNSVAKPAEAGWCVARYLKEAKRVAPPAIATTPTKTETFATIKLERPVSFSSTTIDGKVFQLSPAAAASDAFPAWEPVLQLRWETRAELEARIKAIPSDFMGTTRPTIEARPVTLKGHAGEELCAIVRRTAGHASTVDGVHHAMPDEIELVHAYLFPTGGRTLSAAYRLPPGQLDALVIAFERVLESIRF